MTRCYLVTNLVLSNVIVVVEYFKVEDVRMWLFLFSHNWMNSLFYTFFLLWLKETLSCKDPLENPFAGHYESWRFWTMKRSCDNFISLQTPPLFAEIKSAFLVNEKRSIMEIIMHFACNKFSLTISIEKLEWNGFQGIPRPWWHPISIDWNNETWSSIVQNRCIKTLLYTKHNKQKKSNISNAARDWNNCKL